MSELGEQLRQIRQSEGLSILGVSKRSNVSKTLVSNYEHGRTVPNYGTLVRVLNAMNHEVRIHKKEEL